MSEEEDFVTCQVCQKKLKEINNTHLKTHQLTIVQYRELYPGAETISEVRRQKMREDGQRANDGVRGKKRDEEFGQKVSAGKKGKPNGWKGKKHKQSSKDKGSKTRKDRLASGEIVHPNLGVACPDEKKQKLSEANKGQQLTPEQHAKWQTAMELIWNDPDYKGPMDGKKHSAGALAKMEKQRVRITTELNAQTLSRVRTHLEQFDIDTLEKTETGYQLHCCVCDTYFHRVRSVMIPSKYVDYNGEYCPTCYPTRYNGYWSYEDFDKFPEEKDRPGELYLLKMSKEGEEFLKIGITVNGVYKRWGSTCEDYKVVVLNVVQMTIFEAFCLEQKIIGEFVSHCPSTSFGGKTECLKIDQLEEVLKRMREPTGSLSNQSS